MGMSTSFRLKQNYLILLMLFSSNFWSEVWNFYYLGGGSWSYYSWALLKLISSDYEFHVFRSSLLKSSSFLLSKFTKSATIPSLRPKESNWNLFSLICSFLGESFAAKILNMSCSGMSSKIIELVSFFLNSCLVFEKALWLISSEKVCWVNVSVLVYCSNLS